MEQSRKGRQPQWDEARGQVPSLMPGCAGRREPAATAPPPPPVVTHELHFRNP